MTAPQTYNEVMRWFGTDHHAGHYDLHGMSLLLDHRNLNQPIDIWNYVIDHHLLCVESNEFWITPRGKVWNVSFAMHEFLLVYPMEEVEVQKVELAGWLRVSKTHALHRTKLTKIQLETLAKLRPDLQPRLVFNELKRRVRYDYAERFDVPPLKLPWTTWVPEIDERKE